MPTLRPRLLLALLVLSACPDGRAEDDEPAPKGGVVDPLHTNRLAKESSPYLLQHAHNPVDWYPWGDEAFEKANELDRPVFLSIGYATCHWCHVMEHESFENEEIAKFMNEHFVSIKVDREERPDIDAIYMSAVQAMTGQGGWPLSVFLTPDRKPFYGGTYFPPDDRYGRPGFPKLLAGIADAWENRRPELLSSAERIVSHLASNPTGSEPVDVGKETLALAVGQLAPQFDAERGGFGGAPKFPRSHTLMFLLRQAERSGEKKTLRMVTTTLDHMARGGIRDHLGGGFHRYSTDRNWLVPHFEKMLYDQALLVRAYVEAWQVTGEERYAEIARDVLRYVTRDMTDPAGGFYSAEDADSEGVEGKFYVWTLQEVLDVLGEEDGKFFAGIYGVKEGGNFVDEASREATKGNILHLAAPLAAAEEARLAPLREKLFAVREKRVHPLKDDKVLTDWNGLMIGAFARAGRALDEPAFVAAAVRCGEFVLSELVRDGRLLHRWRNGEKGIPAFLDDYAFLAEGLFDLYEATLDPRWLRESKRLLDEMIRRFGDAATPGFFLTGSDAEQHVIRTREIYDGALPSGNSVAALTLLRAARLLMDDALRKEGDETLAAFSGQLAEMPVAYTYLLMALDFAVGPAREMVFAGEPGDAVFLKMRREVDRRFLPRAVVAFHPDGDAGKAVEELIPFLAGQGPVDGRSATYVCTDYACAAPVTTPEALEALLDEGD